MFSKLLNYLRRYEFRALGFRVCVNMVASAAMVSHRSSSEFEQAEEIPIPPATEAPVRFLVNVVNLGWVEVPQALSPKL